MRDLSRSRRNCRAQERRGATVIEMAFAAPILFMMLFGLFEFGYAYMMQHLMQDSAREGCRVAVLPTSSNIAVLSAVNQSLLARGVNGATTSILVNNASGNLASAVAGDEIQIQITVPTSNVSVIPKGYLNGQLTAACIRRKE